jgi:two-component sensor histidine kinase
MIDDGIQSNCSQFAEADHRIANHLALLACYVRLKGTELVRRDPPPGVADLSLLLEAINVQINAISRVHRLLSSGAQGSADLGHHLGMICSALGSGVSGNVVIAGSFGSDCTVALHRLLPAAQIVTEVLTNAIKHGRRAGQPGRIEVACGKDADGTVFVEISDDGPGLLARETGEEKCGLGYRLVQALVDQIDGTVEYLSTNQGLTVRLSLPRAGARAGKTIPAGVSALFDTTEIIVGAQIGAAIHTQSEKFRNSSTSASESCALNHHSAKAHSQRPTNL